MNFQSCSLNYYTISYFIPIKYLLFNNNSRKAVDLNNVHLRLISRLDLKTLRIFHKMIRKSKKFLAWPFLAFFSLNF